MTLEEFSSVICLVQEDPAAHSQVEQSGIILLSRGSNTWGCVTNLKNWNLTAFCLKLSSAELTLIVV